MAPAAAAPAGVANSEGLNHVPGKTTLRMELATRYQDTSLVSTRRASYGTPDISDPTGVVLFLILVGIALLFDRSKHAILNQSSEVYHPVIHAFFEELSTFGFVSLLAFLCKKEWSGGSSIVYLIGGNIGEGYGYVVFLFIIHEYPG